jgi:hypothetical protein
MDKDAEYRNKASKLDEAKDYAFSSISNGFIDANYIYEFNNATTATVYGMVTIKEKCYINEISLYCDTNTSAEIDILSSFKDSIDISTSLIDKTGGGAPIVLNSEIKKTDKILNKWTRVIDNNSILKIELKNNTLAKDITVVINTTKLT